MALPVSFLGYQRFRHLKATIVLLVLATAIYVIDDPVGGRNGGTWVGYGLGALSAALVLWLLWFGIRKRSYASPGAPLQGWLSAHVYLGVALLALVPLHSGFQFGWNVHTLAYALLVVVVLSGIVGVVAYSMVPNDLTRDRAGRRFDSFLAEIADIDAECRSVASAAPNPVAQGASVSLEDTRIGGGLLRQLSGRNPGCGNARGLEQVLAARARLGDEGRQEADRIAELLTRKESVLRSIRRDLRQRALLNSWLVLHVPLSLATVAAVAVHVFTVFWYW